MPARPNADPASPPPAITTSKDRVAMPHPIDCGTVVGSMHIRRFQTSIPARPGAVRHAVSGVDLPRRGPTVATPSQAS